MERRWQLGAQRQVFENDRIVVYEDDVVQPDGNASSYTVIEERAGAVAIVAVDADGRIVLIRQHRYPVDVTSLEAPSGEIRKGADPIAEARRELQEETGIRAARLEELGRFAPWPARLRCWVSVVLATELDLSAAGVHNQLPDESIQGVALYLPSEVRELIRRGSMIHGATLAALSLYWSVS